MKELAIFTYKYIELLNGFAVSCAQEVRRKNNMYFVKCTTTEPAFISRLLNLLIDIALQENPIYQQSPKLREMAKDLHQTEVYTNLKNALATYVRYNRVLHLEGYIAFRMAEYREKLDMMSYSLIKKMKLIQHD